MRIVVVTLAVTMSLGFGGLAALAEWSSDSNLNLAVGDRTGEQVQPKLQATSDGGCYVSWFDNSAGGYDLYLQRLDPEGNELWAHNGVLIADRSFSSTQDYDLAVDAGDNAILAYRDDRGVGTQIGSNRVTPDGTLSWGASGVLLTSTTDFVASPKVAVTSDGFYVFGWSQEADFVLQKLDAAGAAQWGGGIAQVAGGGSYILSDLVGSDAGAVIALWVRPLGNILSDKHLYSQKFSSAGSALWGGGPVVVYDGGSVQIGYFPTFLSDGSGGAIYGWYEVSGSRNAYVQHVNSAGTEVCPHNGVAVSTLATTIRLSPDLAYNEATGEMFLFWTESNLAQSMWGVRGQKVSALGVRQWTGSGVELVPLGANQNSFIRCASLEDGATVAYFEKSGASRVQTLRVDGDGDFVWTGDIIDACSVLSDKSRLFLDCNGTGQTLLAWTDDRTDSGDVFAQNVNSDGTLGPDGAPIESCGVGAINTGCGPTADVLFINGTAGGSERTLTVKTSTALTMTLEEPASRQGDGETSDSCVYGWVGAPGASDLVVVPKGLGDMCFGPFIIATKAPKKIWNSLGFETKLGTDNAPGGPPVIPDSGSFELLSLPGGLGQAVTATFQGVVEDDCSQGTVDLSITNGMVLVIE